MIHFIVLGLCHIYFKGCPGLTLVNISSSKPQVHGTGVQMVEQLGKRAIIRRFPAVPNDVVSLGKALHPTCLGGERPCTYCK